MQSTDSSTCWKCNSNVHSSPLWALQFFFSFWLYLLINPKWTFITCAIDKRTVSRWQHQPFSVWKRLMCVALCKHKTVLKAKARKSCQGCLWGAGLEKATFHFSLSVWFHTHWKWHTGVKKRWIWDGNENWGAPQTSQPHSKTKLLTYLLAISVENT